MTNTRAYINALNNEDFLWFTRWFGRFDQKRLDSVSGEYDWNKFFEMPVEESMQVIIKDVKDDLATQKWLKKYAPAGYEEWTEERLIAELQELKKRLQKIREKEK